MYGFTVKIAICDFSTVTQAEVDPLYVQLFNFFNDGQKLINELMLEFSVTCTRNLF